jgi:predicted secreted protein
MPNLRRGEIEPRSAARGRKLVLTLGALAELAADRVQRRNRRYHARGIADRWRELLDGAGVKRASIAGRGLFKDAATDELMRQTFFDGAVKNFQIIIPDFGTVQGAFQITSLEFAGEHNGDVTYEMALESAGALTFAAAG